MPEAFAVLFVFVVAVAAYTSARIQAADPNNRNPVAEFSRLKQHRAWLEERLQLARRENWDQAMLARLAEEIDAVDAVLAKAKSAMELTH